MTAYAILVDFRLRPGMLAAFRRLVDSNARHSVRDEDGCRRFDVLEPHGEENRVLLYEIYTDRAAFDAHVKSEHFARFDAESSALVAAKSVVECDLVLEGSA
ncbi:MAG: antibiotic biosynthesis monooxygenase [Bauldia sp.]|nr:antibiotic biosynthesis monooxygenase [Bauldia sp.]